MRKRIFTLLAGLVLVAAVHAQPNVFSVTTLNCYFFFGGSVSGRNFDQPRFAQDYWRKAANLVSLLPTNAPLLVALQEVGWQREVSNLARCAQTRYHRPYQAFYVKGRDTFTEENVGVLFDPSRGWGVAQGPSRDASLDRVISKHLTLQLTNAVTALEVCVVHLHRGMDLGGLEKQKEQNAALKLWAEKILAKNPKANVIVLGDFNESQKVNDPKASIDCLVHGNSPLTDAFTLTSQFICTHADGKAYDRILLSPALVRGTSWLELQNVFSQPHPFGKGDNRRLYTDHFPVTAMFSLVAPAKR